MTSVDKSILALTLTGLGQRASFLLYALALFCLLGLTGCDSGPEIIKISGSKMGTTYHITVVADQPAPDDLARFIASKGSVALNGTSLTVNEVEGNVFGINFIPHTKDFTTWGDVALGDMVNLEIDTLARYVARLAEAG